MRIALLTESDEQPDVVESYGFAGTQRHILELARGLRELGQEPVIACPDDSPLAAQATRAGLHHLPIPKRGKHLNTAAVRSLRAGDFDVVHAHDGRSALAAALAVRLAGRGRCVSTQHYLKPCRASRKGLKSLASRLAHRWVDRHTHGRIAVSQAVRDNMVERGEATAEEVAVIRNGIADAVRSGHRPSEATRNEFDIPRDAVLLVCVCRPQREADLTTLIEAMPLLPASPRVRLVISATGAQKVLLRAKVAQWKCEDCVSVCRPGADALALVAAADVFVLPGKSDAFEPALLEAMSLGKPVVATAAGGPLEIVEQGVTGLLVPPSDPGALAAALRTLILDPAARAAMGEQGLRRFRDHFTADRMAAETLELYRHVVGAGPTPTVYASAAAAV